MLIWGHDTAISVRLKLEHIFGLDIRRTLDRLKRVLGVPVKEKVAFVGLGQLLLDVTHVKLFSILAHRI